jgi:hypothetical protein
MIITIKMPVKTRLSFERPYGNTNRPYQRSHCIFVREVTIFPKVRASQPLALTK